MSTQFISNSDQAIPRLRSETRIGSLKAVIGELATICKEPTVAQCSTLSGLILGLSVESVMRKVRISSSAPYKPEPEKHRRNTGAFGLAVPTARIKSASGSTDKTYRLSSSFNCSLIERACSRSMLAYCFGSAMCCAHDSSEKRGTDTFLPGRFDQGFIQ